MTTSPRRADTDLIEGAKIIALTVGAGCLYGILHDLVTTRVCLIYFTEAHPPIFGGTHDPTLLAFGWGVLATWWVGLMLGVLLCASARLGSRPPFTARDLAPSVARLLIVMASLASVAGFCTMLSGVLSDQKWVYTSFQIDLASHTMSYVAGFLGGIILCVLTMRRRRLQRLEEQISPI